MALLVAGYALILFFVIAAFLYIQRSVRKEKEELIEAHRNFLGHGAKYDVLFFSKRSLSHLLNTKKQSKKMAVITCSGGDLRMVIEDASLEGDVRLNLSPENCQLRLIDLGPFAGRFSKFIELKLPETSIFLAAAKDTSTSPRLTKKLLEKLSPPLPRLPPLHFAFRGERFFLLALLAVIVISSGGFLYRLSNIAPSGPIAVLRSPSAHLLAFNRSDILFLDENGHLNRIHHQGASDFRSAAFRPDGSFYMMDGASKKLLLCHNTQCSHSKIEANPPLENNISMTVSPDGQYLITSEPKEDRVRVFSHEGRELQRLSPPNHRLCFPNGATFGKDGKFYLTDTNLNRVVVFSFENDRLHEEKELLMVDERPLSAGQECSGGKSRRFWNRAFPAEKAAPLPGARPGRVWPMDIAQLEDGRWAVLIAKNGMRNADIVIFNEDWTQPKPLSMPGNSDIVSITSWEEGLAAADFGSPGLWEIKKNRILPWQDQDFRQWMARIDASLSQYRLWKNTGPIILMFLLLMILGGVLLTTHLKLRKLSLYANRMTQQEAAQCSLR